MLRISTALLIVLVSFHSLAAVVQSMTKVLVIKAKSPRKIMPLVSVSYTHLTLPTKA